MQATSSFFAWCEGLGLQLLGVMPVHVAAWLETLIKDGRAAPTVQQHADRMAGMAGGAAFGGRTSARQVLRDTVALCGARDLRT